MEPIATYSEVRFDGSRIFTLLADKIVLRGTLTLQADFDATIPLAIIDPNPDTIRFRHRSFQGGLWMALIGFVGSTILVSGLHMSFAQFSPIVVGGIGFAGLLLMASTWKKVEFVRFKNDGGIIVLEIARSGDQSAQFDAFIDALCKQIRITRDGLPYT